MARTLRIEWSEEAAELPAWQLLYLESQLAASESPPIEPIVIPDFTLLPATTEIILRVPDGDFSIPILVTDLIALPVDAGGNNLDINDVLQLLGRRIGIEQAIYRAQNRTSRDSQELDAIFGTGFSPTDVFRAWWTITLDLQDKALSVNRFRLMLEGNLSVGYAWQCMNAAMASAQMDSVEVWFYGAELMRELETIELAESPDRDAKLSLLSSFKLRIRNDLEKLAPNESDLKWLKTIKRFYSGAK